MSAVEFKPAVSVRPATISVPSLVSVNSAAPSLTSTSNDSTPAFALIAEWSVASVGASVSTKSNDGVVELIEMSAVEFMPKPPRAAILPVTLS